MIAVIEKLSATRKDFGAPAQIPFRSIIFLLKLTTSLGRWASLNSDISWVDTHDIEKSLIFLISKKNTKFHKIMKIDDFHRF